MLLDSIEAGIDPKQYETMDLLEVAYAIEGYRQRVYTRITYNRHLAWISMLPHVKKDSLNNATDIMTLPTDSIDSNTPVSIEEMQEYWNKIDNSLSI